MVIVRLGAITSQPVSLAVKMPNVKIPISFFT